MQSASISLLKKTLENYDSPELIALCLRMAKYKKDNKELLSYLLFDEKDKEGYIQTIKMEMDDEFDGINTSSYYFIKKSVRKILRTLKKHIRYTQSRQVEVELILYWCSKMRTMQPPYEKNVALANLYDRQIALIDKSLKTLDPDLQYDYQQEIEKLS